MKRQEANRLQRAYLLWSIAGVSLIAAAVAGSSVFRLVSGTADTAEQKVKNLRKLRRYYRKAELAEERRRT